MAKKKTVKQIKLYVVKRVGHELPGHGWQPYGRHFSVSQSFGNTLAHAAPTIFSLTEPPPLPVPQEPEGGST